MELPTPRDGPAASWRHHVQDWTGDGGAPQYQGWGGSTAQLADNSTARGLRDNKTGHWARAYYLQHCSEHCLLSSLITCQSSLLKVRTEERPDRLTGGGFTHNLLTLLLSSQFITFNSVSMWCVTLAVVVWHTHYRLVYCSLYCILYTVYTLSNTKYTV